jgi:hypothetical protein
MTVTGISVSVEGRYIDITEICDELKPLIKQK